LPLNIFEPVFTYPNRIILSSDVLLRSKELTLEKKIDSQVNERVELIPPYYLDKNRIKTQITETKNQGNHELGHFRQKLEIFCLKLVVDS